MFRYLYLNCKIITYKYPVAKTTQGVIAQLAKTEINELDPVAGLTTATIKDNNKLTAAKIKDMNFIWLRICKNALLLSGRLTQYSMFK